MASTSTPTTFQDRVSTLECLAAPTQLPPRGRLDRHLPVPSPPGQTVQGSLIGTLAPRTLPGGRRDPLKVAS